MKYGFLGSGNMGSALACSICKVCDSGQVAVADAFPEKAKALAEKLGCVYTDNETVILNAKFIFIAVKPQALAALFEEISPLLAQRKTPAVLVSMAAGIPIKQIRVMSCGNYPIIRIMPNTPVSVSKGLILCAFNEYVTEEIFGEFSQILSAAGVIDSVDEGFIDAASAVSGCGPAFAYMFIEALADGAVSCGLPRDKALTYAAQTLLGAAELALTAGKHPAQLKDEVCSPGGSTIAGVRALEDAGFRAAAINAVIEAFKRTKELGKK